MGKAHRKEMAASCHFRHSWFLGAVKNGFQVQLGVSRKLTAPLRGFLLDAILQHRSNGVTGASRSFYETQCTLRGFCQSPCSLNCVALFVLRLFKILPFWEGALMSFSNCHSETRAPFGKKEPQAKQRQMGLSCLACGSFCNAHL